MNKTQFIAFLVNSLHDKGYTFVTIQCTDRYRNLCIHANNAKGQPVEVVGTVYVPPNGYGKVVWDSSTVAVREFPLAQ